MAKIRKLIRRTKINILKGKIKMKSLKFKYILKSLVVAGSMLAGFSSVQAAEGELININFYPVDESYNDSAFQGGSTPQTWNIFYDQDSGGTPVELTKSVGAGTASMEYSFGSVNMTEVNSGFSSDPVQSDLMGGYVASGVAGSEPTGSISISGLDANAGYKLYFYTQGSKDDMGLNGQYLSVNVNGDVLIQSTASDLNQSSFIEGQNVLVGSFNTNGAGKLDMLFSPKSGSSVVVLNGLQIEGLGSPVPEPASIVLLGVGGLFALGYSRGRYRQSVVAES
ncbi:MAG: PEP-CTERM sorting domain-containing protein [Chlorobiaceae bacterium]|nr:PEP-CTERM sorting domain-containing protein [Chlorobiaceae bacterium]